MAILRLSNGELITGYSEINELIVPAGMEVGRFNYPDPLEAKVKSMEKPLNQDGAEFIFSELSANVESVVKDLDFSYNYRRAGIFVPAKEKGGTSAFSMAGDDQMQVASAEMTPADLANYMAPHILRANNLHFSFQGAFIKGMQLGSDLQAMIYVLAGEWQRLDPNILSWVVFPSGEPVIGLSFFDQKPNASGAHETDVFPDTEISGTVKF